MDFNSIFGLGEPSLSSGRGISNHNTLLQNCVVICVLVSKYCAQDYYRKEKVKLIILFRFFFFLMSVWIVFYNYIHMLMRTIIIIIIVIIIIITLWDIIPKRMTLIN